MDVFVYQIAARLGSASATWKLYGQSERGANDSQDSSMTHRGRIEWAKLYTAVPQPPVIGGCGPQEITVRKSSRCLWPLKADEPLAFGGHGALDELEVVAGDAGAYLDAPGRFKSL